MVRAELVGRLDAQRACDGAAHRQRLAMRIVQRNEQGPYPLIDGVPGVRQAQMARRALDQPQAEIGFQPLHCSTEARFGMAEHARGGAKAAMLHDLAKQLPIAPVHRGHRPRGGTVCPGNPDTSETAYPIEDDTKAARFAKHTEGETACRMTESFCAIPGTSRPGITN